ncbi:MAG: efflux RND transporter periplasmic adaptor subunit [Ignavibacteria bacterium]|nr:efflux RND transporter periplasmic adaptor subunit [Ignavibacteria bacterium]
MKLFTRVLIILLSAGLIATLVYFKSSDTPKISSLVGKKQPAVNVGITVATMKNIDRKIILSGSLLAYREAELHTEASGKVVNFNLPEGQLVKQGTLLVKINDADLQAQLLKNTEQIRHAEEIESRQKALLSRGGSSREEYEAALNSLNLAKADKELILANIAKTEVRAPFDGIIGLKYITIGAYVTPSTKVVSIIQPDPMKLECSIPEKYASFMKKGNTLTFLTRGSTKRYNATIYAVDPRIDFSTRTIAVRADVANSKGALTSGSFVEIELPIGDSHLGLMVPTEAIIPDIKGQKVFIVKNGKAEPRPIVTGVRTENELEIIQGISAGDTVITTGILLLKPNSPVVIR